MLQQVQAELQEANDLKRGELIKNMIEDLSKRYQEMKASGGGSSTIDRARLYWRFCPGDQGPLSVRPRGTDMVVRRDRIAGAGQEWVSGGLSCIMLDKLLQELNLGSSELASADTQRRQSGAFGGHLGFIDFARASTIRCCTCG